MINKQEFYTPSETPKCIKRLDSNTKQLGVGKSGKNGYLKAIFEYDKSSNKTVIKEQLSQVPLHMHRAIYHDTNFPGMPYLYVMSASGGILQGDRYRMDITLKSDATGHITTQGATRIYGMNTNWATQIINVTLNEDAYLELIPDQIIPYKNSRFYQSLNLNIHESATLVCSEMVVPGRVGMGESFAYDACYLKTTAHNHKGTIRFVDVSRMEPMRQQMTAPEVMGDYKVVGSVYILTPKQNVANLEDIIHVKITSPQQENNAIKGGVSRMKDDTGLLVRMLGMQATHVRELILKIVADIRMECKGVGFADLRKG